MSLTDLMSGSGQSMWTQVALVVFLAAFLAICFNVLRRPRGEVERQARLPLEDHPGAPGGRRNGERHG